MKILVYGYGNPGREDDGLGILFTEKLKKWICQKKIKNIYVDSNYQLNIEDTFEVSKFDVVFFVDASKIIKTEFKIKKLNLKRNKFSNFYTTHKLLPENILFLSDELFRKQPDVYLITIKGYKWGLSEIPSKKGMRNLNLAFLHFKNFLLKNKFIKKTN